MHFYYAFLAIDFAFGIHGLVPGQQLINLETLTRQVGNKCFSMCLPGNTGDSFQDFPRKFAKVYFRYTDATKEKRRIAKEMAKGKTE